MKNKELKEKLKTLYEKIQQDAEIQHPSFAGGELILTIDAFGDLEAVIERDSCGRGCCGKEGRFVKVNEESLSGLL